MTYITKAGDMWDLIAYEQLGSCDFIEPLINANRDFVATFIFSAGVELTLPEVATQIRTVQLPPWRR